MVGEADVLDFVCCNCVEEFGGLWIPVLPPSVRDESHQIHRACLERAVHYRDPAHDRVEVGGDSPLEIRHRELALAAAELLQAAIEAHGVAAFVPYRTGELPAQLPGRVGQNASALGDGFP